MKRAVALTLVALMAASASQADDGQPPSTGLSVFAGAGALWADKGAAAYYDGRPERINTINRVLHSSQYGTEIWNHLVSSGTIAPSAIGNYSQLAVVEYPPRMFYRLTSQMGVGIRYDYHSGFGWLFRVDLAELQATGAFNLSTGETQILGQHQYITCGILGKEKRIALDIAITKTLPLSSNLEIELDLGASLINTQVKDNIIEVAGSTYSILDRWGGETPDVGVGAYANNPEQGGIGYGIFSSLMLGYRVAGIGALRFGYTCSQTKTVMQTFQSWGWQHMLGVRVEMNNFRL